MIDFIRPAVTALAVTALFLMPAALGAQEPQGAAQELSEPVLTELQTAFELYEEVRKALAEDSLEGVPESASSLAETFDAARRADDGLDLELQWTLDTAALAAESLAEADELEPARAAFAAVSRNLLLLANVDPRLMIDWTVFSCPMAEDFDKWIQRPGEMANPYMGLAMLRCGALSDWSVGSPEPEPLPELPSEPQNPGDPNRPEPEFEPGIPGVTMVDVRDLRFLWREIEELQSWERGNRLSAAEFRDKAIEKTAHYLELDGAAGDRFMAAAAQAVASIRESFLEKRTASSDPLGGEQFQNDLRAALELVTSTMGTEPRHVLFEPELRKWLLKLAFGPREAKERRETQSSQAG